MLLYSRRRIGTHVLANHVKKSRRLRWIRPCTRSTHEKAQIRNLPFCEMNLFALHRKARLNKLFEDQCHVTKVLIKRTVGSDYDVV